MPKMKQNKYEYLFVTQGHYGTWEDIDTNLTMREAKASLKAYRENEKATRFRLIKRRELIQPLSAYQTGLHS